MCYLFHFIIQPWNCSMENTDKRQVKFTQTDQQLITWSVLWEAYLKLRSSGLLEAVEELLTVHQDLGQTCLGFQGVHPLSLHQLNLETKITLTVVHIIKPFEAYCKTRRACACVCMHVCVCAHACVCVRSCACTHRVCQMWPFKDSEAIMKWRDDTNRHADGASSKRIFLQVLLCSSHKYVAPSSMCVHSLAAGFC